MKASPRTGIIDVAVGGKVYGLSLTEETVEALKLGGLIDYELEGTAASNDTLSGDSLSYGFTISADIDREDLATHF